MNPSKYLECESQYYRHGQKIIKIGMDKWDKDSKQSFDSLIDPKKQTSHQKVNVFKYSHQPGSAAITQAKKVMIAK